MSKPLPPVNAESDAYWAACAEGRLTLQRCDDCQHVQFYHRLLCSACGSRALSLVDASGKGRVRTFTIIRRAVSEAFEPDVPYVVALIELAEGPTMMTNVVHCDAESVRIGQPVTLTFESRGEVSVPQFQPE